MSTTTQSQKAIPTERFARILGQRPAIRSRTNCKLFEFPELLSQAFGPPEIAVRKRSSVVFWNFSREDRPGVFTVFARVMKRNCTPGEVPIRFAAHQHAGAFQNWAMDRLGAVGNGDEAPQFLDVCSRAIDGW